MSEFPFNTLMAVGVGTGFMAFGVSSGNDAFLFGGAGLICGRVSRIFFDFYDEPIHFVVLVFGMTVLGPYVLSVRWGGDSLSSFFLGIAFTLISAFPFSRFILSAQDSNRRFLTLLGVYGTLITTMLVVFAACQGISHVIQH